MLSFTTTPEPMAVGVEGGEQLPENFPIVVRFITLVRAVCNSFFDYSGLYRRLCVHACVCVCVCLCVCVSVCVCDRCVGFSLGLARCDVKELT